MKEDSPSQKIRKVGGGRKQHKESQVGLIEALESIVTPHTRGDPMKVLYGVAKAYAILRNY